MGAAGSRLRDLRLSVRRGSRFGVEAIDSVD